MAANCDVFNWIIIQEKICISLKFVSNAPIGIKSALVQVMAWQQAITWINDD